MLQENTLGSMVEIFAPMIRAGGGKHIRTLPGPEIGDGAKMHYILSEWD